MNELEVLKAKIGEFRRKTHINSLIRGSLQFLILVGVGITLISILEHYFWFSSGVRTALFFATTIIYLLLFCFWVLLPAGHAWGLLKSPLSDELLADKIGNAFPDVKDRLTNALQLQQLSSSDNSLILAGISAHIEKLRPIPFTDGISYRVNLKYVRYAAFIMLSMALFSFLIPGIYSNSTKRVLDFDKEFVKPMPFTFNVTLQDEVAFAGEPFTVKVQVDGQSLPNQVYLWYEDRKIYMTKVDERHYSHTIENLQNTVSFRLQAGGFVSTPYMIPVHSRATLSNMILQLRYPAHTGKLDETTNVGRLSIPEGTEVEWTLSTTGTSSAILNVYDSLDFSFQAVDNQQFKQEYQFLESGQYELFLENEFGQNKERIRYQVDVIPDEFPQVEASFYLDTLLYEYVLISGETVDDYGVKSITVFALEDNQVVSSEVIKRPTNQSTSSFYHQLTVDSIFRSLDTDKQRSIYVSVRDNDAINGYKSTRSESFFIRLPKKEDINAQMSKRSKETADGLDKSIDKANAINDKIQQLRERLLNKNKLEWQEEKLLEELLKQRKQIEEEVQQLQEKFDQMNQTEEKFTEKSEAIQEKAQQLQKLMDEVLDEETKKMYEELQKLMEENADIEDLKNQLDNLSTNESNLEKELERALELFKRLKVETELEKASQELQEIGEKQEELSKETEKSASEMDSNTSEEQREETANELSDEQKNLNEAFNKVQEQLDKVEQLNQELKNPEPLPDLNEEIEDIKKGLQKAQESLEEQQFDDATQQQKSNSQKIKQLGEKMSQMMQSMQMEMLSEDTNNLKNIVDNLVKLSFRQEELINAFYEVKQVDPRFVELSQEQLKLKDDAKIIEDSLIALSQRVVEMSSFITREVGLMNENVDAALKNLRNRDRNKALSNQQFAMTSINNLALLLDDLLQQMQNAMSSGSNKGKPQNQQGEGLPNLKDLQKNLSQQIQQLKQGQQKGRQLSENLAKMAAQQEMLRDKLNELKKSLNGQEGGEKAQEAMDKAMKLMEQNEIDLVNKRLTQQLMDRQEEIITRMLDAEDAMKEQEFDNERKGETAEQIDRSIPKAFREYLLERKKQIELQKTIPIGLNPFYKKEVNDYFRRLSTEN